jgi:hypothetical protein
MMLDTFYFQVPAYDKRFLYDYYAVIAGNVDAARNLLLNSRLDLEDGFVREVNEEFMMKNGRSFSLLSVPPGVQRGG